jgi:putative endonuclease
MNDLGLWAWQEKVPLSNLSVPKVSAKSMRGKMAYLSGLAAEDRVADDYLRRGFQTTRRRWRGKSGEIDLIAQHDDRLIFVEVKHAKSFDRAIESLSQHQIDRILATAGEYLAEMPNGLSTDVRIDVALVDGAGQIKVLENAIGFWAA